VLSQYEGSPSGNGNLEDNPRWQLAQRVAGSKTFAGSQALQCFLLYISERTLSGQGEQVKEQTIGTAVFHRKPDYDPGSDNIVRVRAGQLRQRLARYFDTEGEAEPLLISIPKGGYVPLFEPRPAQPPAATLPAPVTGMPLAEAPVDRPETFTAPNPALLGCNPDTGGTGSLFRPASGINRGHPCVVERHPAGVGADVP